MWFTDPCLDNQLYGERDAAVWLPFESYVATRGLRTLHVGLELAANDDAMAEFFLVCWMKGISAVVRDDIICKPFPKSSSSTLFLRAAKIAHEDILKVLWGNVEDENRRIALLEKRCKSGYTPLMAVARSPSMWIHRSGEGQVGCMRFLISCGAKTDVLSPDGSNLALLAARYSANPSAFTFLAEELHMGFRQSRRGDGSSAVHLWVMSPQLDSSCLKLMVQYGAEVDVPISGKLEVPTMFGTCCWTTLGPIDRIGKRECKNCRRHGHCVSRASALAHSLREKRRHAAAVQQLVLCGANPENIELWNSVLSYSTLDWVLRAMHLGLGGM